MPDSTESKIPTALSRVSELIGAENVSVDTVRRNFMAHDIYHGGGLPAFVVRPTDVSQLQGAVKVCAEAGLAMVPRSGGASYSDGFVRADGGHVLFDMSALDSIEIDKENAVVTVGPGVTWAKLREELAKVGMRTPFWGPFSGLVATIGGSISQNSLSHGTSAHGISAESVLSMDIVLASGELMQTGASSTTRHYGPDLTGLFTGDCGALGFKAAIRLPLIAIRNSFETLSFAFDSFTAYHAGVRLAAIEGLDEEHFGLDIGLSQGQIGKHEGIASRFAIAGEVMRAAPNLFAGLRQLGRMAVAGENAFRAGQFMCHFIIEGVDTKDAGAKAQRLREIMAPQGREIANSVPAFVRAVPFAPLTNILGPRGERWVPLHGVLAHKNAVPFHEALAAVFDRHKSEMDRLGMWRGLMFSPVGSTGFLYEIALYWQDERTIYHETTLDKAFLDSLPKYPANPEARAYVDQLKRELIALYAQFDAAHFQIGRAYSYRERLDPLADALLVSIKKKLDPNNLMNPGALKLD